MARSITGIGMRPPPYDRWRRLGTRPSPPTSGSITSRIRASIVGTTIAWVIASPRARSTHAGGSKAGSWTSRRPGVDGREHAGQPGDVVRRHARPASPRPRRRRGTRPTRARSSSRWRWRSTATLGSPLVPLVCSSTATPSGSSDHVGAVVAASQPPKQLADGDRPPRRRSGRSDARSPASATRIAGAWLPTIARRRSSANR